MNEGQHSYLDPDRVKQLEDIGFIFGEVDRNKYPMPKGSSSKQKSDKTTKSTNADETKDEGEEDHESAEEDENDIVEQEVDEAEEQVEGDDENSGGDEALDPVRESSEPGAGDEGIETAVNLKTDVDQEGESNAVLLEAETGEERKEPATLDVGAAAHEDAPENTPLQRGVWTCKLCKKNDFYNYVGAVAHEAKCYGLHELAMNASMVMM